jgi:hypothetical protein
MEIKELAEAERRVQKERSICREKSEGELIRKRKELG